MHPSLHCVRPFNTQQDACRSRLPHQRATNASLLAEASTFHPKQQPARRTPVTWLDELRHPAVD